eukprot:scaffold215319_cov23-Tisochrysis_lutea.AAC.1
MISSRTSPWCLPIPRIGGAYALEGAFPNYRVRHEADVPRPRHEIHAATSVHINSIGGVPHTFGAAQVDEGNALWLAAVGHTATAGMERARSSTHMSLNAIVHGGKIVGWLQSSKAHKHLEIHSTGPAWCLCEQE